MLALFASRRAWSSGDRLLDVGDPSLTSQGETIYVVQTPLTHSQPSPEALMVGGDSPRWGSLVSAPSPVALGCQGYMLHACAVLSLVAQSYLSLCNPMDCSP